MAAPDDHAAPTDHAPPLSTVGPFGFSFDPARFLAAYRALGCEGVQVYRDPAHAPPASGIVETVERLGMRIDSLHGLFGPDIDASSPDRAVRERALRVFEEEGRYALALGARLVVLHPAANTPMRPDFTPERVYSPEQARAAQAGRLGPFEDACERLAAIGDRLGVTYAFENIGWNAPLGHDPRAIAEVVGKVAAPRVRMCFDTGHAQATAGDAPAALRDCAPVIAYIHVHDWAHGRDHLAPGEGVIDWAAVAAALREQGVAATRMLEVFEEEAGVEARAADGSARRRLADMLALEPAP